VNNVSYGTLLDFEAAFWLPSFTPRPLGLDRGEITDFSGGLMSDQTIVPWEQNRNRYRYNQGIQTRYPGVACLPYVLKNQGAVGGAGPVAYWDMDDATGDALDNVGANDLTETSGTIASVAGKVGTARDFERGDTEHFEAADAAWNSITGDLTIAAWINPETATGIFQGIAGKLEVTGDQCSYLLAINDLGQVTFECSSDGTRTSAAVYNQVQSTTILSAGTWYFCVGRHRSGVGIDVSINAVSEESIAHTAGIFDGTALFQVGAYNAGASNFDGLIDEVGLWNRVLTDAEVAFLYNGGSGRSYEALSVAADADISSYNTNGVRAHGIVSTAGGVRMLVALGTKIYRANTSTGAMEVTPFTIDGGAVSGTFGGNATCIAQGLVGGTQGLLVALEGANDILYTTDATASTIAFTTLKTTTSGDWIAAMRYFPTVGPGAWAIVGTLDSVAGVFSELGTTLAASWDPQQASLEEFVDEMPTSPVSFTSAVLPGAGASNNADGGQVWTNPGNITADDGTDATVAAGTLTEWLVASGFSITGPAATDEIVGVLVEVQSGDGGALNGIDYALQLRVSGTQVGSTKYLHKEPPGIAVTSHLYGAYDDNWFAEIKGSDLGNLEVWFRAYRLSGTFSVDCIKVSVSYRSVTPSRVIKKDRRPFAVIQNDLAITPSVRWVNPEFILVSDGSFATFSSGGADQTSDYMLIGPFFAPGDLAEDMEVHGIQVNIERSQSATTANVEDLVVQLYSGGSLLGLNQAVLATEWNAGETTELIKSYGRAGFTWGVNNVSGADMANLYVAVRVLADADIGQIDAVTMHVEGVVPGQTTSFDGGDLGGIGSTGAGSVKNGWMVSASPTDPEALTIVASGDMFRLTFGWDVGQGRMTYEFTKPNTGLPYVHHAQPYLGGYIVTGGNAIGVGTHVKVVSSSGDVIPYDFPLYHGGSEQRVNSIMVQSLWAIHDVIPTAASNRQWWMMNDQARYFPDTILQSLSESEAGTGLSSIAATPIAWSTQPIYGSLNMIYSVFPNGSDTAWARQFCPPDLSSNPLITNTSEIKSMRFNASGVENTAIYIETPDLDYGPPDANKALLTLRYNDRLVSATGSTYGTVASLVSVDNSSYATASNTFDTGFERHRLATAGTAFRSLSFQFHLAHEAGTAKTPNGLPWVFEADVQMPYLRRWVALVKPSTIQPNLIDFMKNVVTLHDTKTTQTLKVSTVRDGVNTSTLGVVAVLDSFNFDAAFEAPVSGKTPSDFENARGNDVYLQIGFSERIGTVT